MRILALYLVLLVLGPWLISQNPSEHDRQWANAAPSGSHPLGTDEFGRDVLARFVYGGRWSVVAGAAATVAVLLLSWTFGGLAGYFGGWLDQGIMRVVELILVLPWLYLLLGVRALLPLHAPPRTAFLILLLLIACVSWARPARVVRGLVLSIKERGYVAASRDFGIPAWKIFADHILPDTVGLFATQAVLLFPRLVLLEITLSFLGLGAGEPDPSWGALLVPLKQTWILGQEWWRVLPAVLMLPFFAAFAWVSLVADKRFRDRKAS